MKLSINEPCHEDWNGMTPNNKGAFCHSCAKDVVDFSKMGTAQIKNFFSKREESGKICGRFKENQLQELSFDDFFSRFRYWNFSRKFAVIFFMAFSFWLFSGPDAVAQNEQHLQGKVMYVPDKNPKVDTAKTKTPENPKQPKAPKSAKQQEKTAMISGKQKEKGKMLMGDVDISREEKQLPFTKEK
ncbi:MAG: hypothetical protein ACXVPN_08820 [Bacteroidia bacterium]